MCASPRSASPLCPQPTLTGSGSWDAGWGLDPTVLDEPVLDSPHAELPAEFLCPLTLQLMVDPVVTCDGNTYERRAIALWLSQHDTAPLTGEPLRSKELFPCTFARIQIRNFPGQF